MSIIGSDFSSQLGMLMTLAALAIKQRGELTLRDRKALELVLELFDAATQTQGSGVQTAAADRSKPVIVLSGAAHGVAGGVAEAMPGGQTVPSSPNTFTGFSSGHYDEDGEIVPAWSVSGLDPFTATEFINILTDSDRGYERFVALFDDDTTVTGSAFSDRIEVGAGDDIVDAGDGDDVALKWASGDLTYEGGAGRDALYFEGDLSSTAFPNPFTETLVVDLHTGQGRSPYGGDLVLTSVEVIHDTSAADTIQGANAPDTVFIDHGGADWLRLRGGDDEVRALFDFSGVTCLGNGGWDRLSLFGLQEATILDLVNWRNSTGAFQDARIEGVEAFALSTDRAGADLRLRGTDAAESASFANVFAPEVRATFNMGAGDDSVTGGAGADKINGMEGRDSLSGGAGDDRITGGDGLDLILGGEGDDRLFGGASTDRISGGAGDDAIRTGAGFDLLVLEAGFDTDIVLDFDASRDRLDFRAHAGVTGTADLALSQQGGTAVIEDGAGGRIELQGVDMAEVGFLF